MTFFQDFQLFRGGILKAPIKCKFLQAQKAFSPGLTAREPIPHPNEPIQPQNEPIFGVTEPIRGCREPIK